MKTTKKDFEVFKKESLYWIDYFGLKDWRVGFSHKDLDGAEAQCLAHVGDRNCTLSLDVEVEDRSKIKQWAFHEVCELLLFKASDLITATYSNWERSNIIHDVIIRLENSVFKQKGRRKK